MSHSVSTIAGRAPRVRARLSVWLTLSALAVGASGCDAPTEVTPPPGPQTLVLFSTPKLLSDFENPSADIANFLDNYAALTSRAEETIVIFAVGNSEHVLTYKGPDHWADSVEWARFTGVDQVSDQKLRYRQIEAIVREFRRTADSMGIRIKIFDQVDGGAEFVREYFKLNHHPECFPKEYDSFDIRGRLAADTVMYASAPNGIVEGTECGRFLADQVGHYARDLGFDGMLYGNQLGTRGRWQPDAGPGYTSAEAEAIRSFLAYSKLVLSGRELMWFDSYNNLSVERESYSFPADGYDHFDYLIAAGFCVITATSRYLDNLTSKLTLRGRTKVLATLDYVDPWYTYDSMTDFPQASAELENIAIRHRHLIGGLVFFANDDKGNPVPRRLIESFAQRFFAEP